MCVCVCVCVLTSVNHLFHLFNALAPETKKQDRENLMHAQTFITLFTEKNPPKFHKNTHTQTHTHTPHTHAHSLCSQVRESRLHGEDEQGDEADVGEAAAVAGFGLARRVADEVHDLAHNEQRAGCVCV